MHKKYFALLLLITPFLCFGQVGLVEERFAFEPDLSYDASIPPPGSHLGYQLGEEMTLYAHVVDYFETLAEASDKIVLNQYGETYEGRPLINVVISSEGNIENMESLRQRHLQLADPSQISEADAAAIIEEEPVFTSMSYNIHGNEFSSTEAAMQVAYRLVAAQDAETMEVLDNSVIILFICINPDGRDRYAYWYKSMAREVVGKEPRDLEHYAPWPNGRTNHYWFDLNRDWIWGIHPESRGHTAEYQRWMPQVHVDYHEQGYNNNYFTMPGTTPRNKLLPDTYEAWSDTFGMANVREFDRYQLNYFTRDAFDFFYPGYGSSYPSAMGAIGMLTEQGGIAGGRAIEVDDGYVLTLRQRVFDHYTTSIATIKKAAERRQELLRYSYESWKPSGSKSDTKAYLLLDNGNGYLHDVVTVLLRQGVRVEQLNEDTDLSDLKSFRTGEVENRTVPSGSYIISTDQSRHLFINSIMDRNMVIEDSVMYDMATWAAPLAYNLDAYSITKDISLSTSPVEEPPAIASGVENSDAQYAYVIEWRQRHAPRALSMLWEKGYRVRSAAEPFSDGEQSFGAGSLIVLRGRNREKAENIEADIREVAEMAQVRIHGYESGRMREGYDLASSRNRPVKQPRVALMVEPPFSTYTSGQLYFLFDQETRLPVERIRTSILRQTALPRFGARYGYADLNDYDVLILPDGGNDLKELFKEKQLEELKAWVRAGGVIVATESSAKFFTAGESKFTEAKLIEQEKDSSETVKYLNFAERRDYFGKKRIPGSALNAHIDTTHPLAFGADEELYSLKFDTDVLAPSPELETVGYYYQDPEKLLAAGYANQENLEHLTGNTFAAVMPVGEGKVVFLIDNTQYRMFWRGPTRLMQNAVMLLPGF